MIYFKNSDGAVFAYSKEDIMQTERLAELERLIQEQEPVFILTETKLQQKIASIDELVTQYEEITSRDDVSENELRLLEEKINTATAERELLSVEFGVVEAEYKPLKDEFDAVFPVFFEIRDNLKSMKKMTAKEVDMHLNPPIPKERLIAEAVQKKQLLLAEANNAIAPLQDAVDFSMATEQEKKQLQIWKEYRINLSRVDVSIAPDIEWPQSPL
ncbi:tail fiber assembly protein [Providencia sp. PROV190]|uniref:tail fiber assembly protein n=1 Tax=Providencia sp. PROV190 TaxID=2949891 RepID=UPI00234A8AAE|nr:tail fiber assembly protein [Providencia sp. PROV190]